MPIRTFESLRVWHDARRFAAKTYALTRESPFNQDRGLCDQLRRAAISIMSNIAEGYERGRQRELVHYCKIAKGSAAEVRSQIYAAEDVGYADPQTAIELRAEALAITRQLSALIEKQALSSTPSRG